MEGQYCYQYPRPAVTTDCVIFGFDGEILKVLLVERGGEPYKGCWAFPGGFLNMDETTDECAVRELEEETGLRDVFGRAITGFFRRGPRSPGTDNYGGLLCFGESRGDKSGRI